MLSRRASASSSLRVGWSPRRTALASLPRAVLVFEGRFLSVCLLRAPDCAFLTLRLAAWRCLVVAMHLWLPERLGLAHPCDSAPGRDHPRARLRVEPRHARVPGRARRDARLLQRGGGRSAGRG